MADREAFFSLAAELARSGQPFATATVVRVDRPTSGKPGDRSVVTLDGELHGWIGGSCARPTVVHEALAALRDGQARLVRLSSDRDEAIAREGLIDLSMTCFSGGTMEIFIEPHLPRPTLLIAGNQPISTALTELARTMGYTVRTLGSASGESDAVEVDRIAAAVTPLTFVVVASHGESDEIAVEAAVRASAPYVGLVASRRRVESIRSYLMDRGLTESNLACLHAPAGLDLGGERPEEIAVAILAEIVQVGRTIEEFAWSEPSEAESVPPSASPNDSATAIDPICGMAVEVGGSKHRYSYAGEEYHFCCSGCRERFIAEPERFAPVS